jgi:succinoglycan biosynthesis transport protein ExoP
MYGLGDANRVSALDQELVDLNRQLIVARSDLAGREARLVSIRDLQRRGSDTDALIENLNSSVLTDLHREELAVLQSEANITASSAEGQPKAQQARVQLRELRRKIGDEVGRTVSQLEDEIGIFGARVRSIQQRLEAVQSASSEARGAELRLSELRREAAANGQLYESLVRRRNELVEQHEISPDVRILSLAAPPVWPSSPNPILFVFPALILFSIGGGLLAVVIEGLDRGLRSERDINDALAIPCAGLVPQLRGIGTRQPHRYLLKKQLAPYAEAMRSLVAAALELAAPHRSPKVILITSSVPREGKTTLAVSFATYAALLQRRVLLVDLNFRHPGILRELGGQAQRGVLELLRQECLPEEAIQRVGNSTLEYLPLSRCPADPLVPFTGGQIPHLLRQLRESYDCVIIDSSPLLTGTEARLLASMVDKVLISVKWGSTRKEVVQNALKLLCDPGSSGKDRIDLVSAVLTQVDLKKHALYGFGDIGESFATYKKFLAHSSHSN